MLYADSPLLNDLAFVVMDEVHYLADRFRGAVWEEVIIHLPQTVRLVSLSATVSNAEEFGDWLQAVRGDTDVIVSEERPFRSSSTCWCAASCSTCSTRSGARRATEPGEPRARAARGRGRPRRWHVPRRAPGPAPPQGQRRLGLARATAPGTAGARPGRATGWTAPRSCGCCESKNLLPAIFFVFSRVGCDAAVRQVVRSDIRLTERWERDEIRAIVEERTRADPGHRPERARLLGVARRPPARGRGPPRRHAARLQRGRRGAVPAQAAQGRLRDRDPRARRQHARPHRRAREAREVQRRGARADHAGGVHPAHRPRRAPRHRRRGPRRHPVGRRARPAGGRLARIAAQLPADLELPAHLQHGGQPDRAVRPRPHARDPRELVRAVPGRPRRRRPRAPGARAGEVARGLRRGDALPPRRLRAVLRPAPRAQRPREEERPRSAATTAAPSATAASGGSPTCAGR